MLFEDGAGVTDARLRYRRDIDGLRGLAVLLVMGDHLGVRGFAGGYIGVDVFFVISGYLISSIILPQIAAGTFSFREFYLRRLRRIYPALLVMLAVTTPLAWHYLLPFDMRDYGTELLSSAFGFSNLVNLHTFGYFDPDVRFHPLRHTWSLGVEEQFYLLLPLCLVLGVWAVGARRMRFCIAGFALLSFIAAYIMVQWRTDSAFYQPQYRAWELLTGVLISQPGFPKLRAAWQRNVASLLGVGLIVFCLWRYDPWILFPGPTAVPACLGAALIIAAGETGPSVVGELLGLRPMVFVGLISYSLYLWHWPIQVYWDIQHTLRLSWHVSRESKEFVFVASFVVATLSWRYIELPFRRSGAIGTKRVLLLAGVSMAALAVFAVRIEARQGYPSRWPADAVRVSDYMDPGIHTDNGRWGICAIHGQGASALRWPSLNLEPEQIQAGACLPFTPGRRHYLLVGDSHSAFLWSGLSHVFPELQIGQADAAICGVYGDSLYSQDANCAGVDHLIYDDLVPNHKVDTILMSYYWNQDHIRLVSRVVAYARRYGVEVIVVGPTDSFIVSLPRVLAVASLDPSKPVQP